jgi:hypothetical protein
MQWIRCLVHGSWIVTVSSALCFSTLAAADDFKIKRASWSSEKSRLLVRGEGQDDRDVTLTNAGSGAVIGSDEVDDEKWRVVKRNPSSIPCRVRAAQSDGQTAERDVSGAPADCDAGGPVNNPPVCVIDAPGGDMTVQAGDSVNFQGAVTDPDDDPLNIVWTFQGGTPNTSGNEDPGDVVFESAGTFQVTLSATDDRGAACAAATRTISVQNAPQTGLITDPVFEEPFLGNQNYRVLAANDLGMHCADQDDQIFSILPPFNVLHAQVIRRGSDPDLVTPEDFPDMSLVYSAASNPDDPVFDPNHPTLPADLNPPAVALAGQPRANVSINSTAQNDPLAGIFKGNFWETNPDTGNPYGFDAYDNIFFGLLDPAAVAQDTGLPVPDSVLLPDCLADPPSCEFGQQVMPGIDDKYADNRPILFDRFDRDINFFSSVLPAPLGSVVQETNWYAADGIPILPIDDAGRVNAYPLMRVQAVKAGSVVASTDVVLPVASEADCQNCHVDPVECADIDLPQLIQSDSCNGVAVPLEERNFETLLGYSFALASIDDAGTPGADTGQKLLNAAKINILRLHDVKHGGNYPAGWGQCTDPADPDCLANRVPIQCAQCHYTPALDLAQLGPTDDPTNQVFQATVNKTMSSMMHGHHGEFSDLFPTMPPPDDASRDLLVDENGDPDPNSDQTLTEYVLQETCYQCHPGKRTQCLRGAMAAGGMVCQDCHGEMADVGDDFTNGGSRVPWASEPGCQSCHTGDALEPNHPPGAIIADDGIRLLQAYLGEDANAPIQSPNSRFAENESLYRLSGNQVTANANQGHEGIMCEGCHGSTHAIWPNANPFANDNVAANQLQGHSGTIIECDTCHTGGFDIDDFKSDVKETGEMGGPHGMHPIDAMWNDKHKEVSELNKNSCRTCHGPDGEGTVLSRMAQTRTLECKDEEPSGCGGDKRITLIKGTEVSCVLCHKENQL